jgi:hypothetical protein
VNKKPRRDIYEPFTSWSSLAFRTAETLAASAQVIHHRTSRCNSPAQLFEMGNEKLQAAVESSHAMIRHWLAMRDTSALGLAQQWGALLASGLAPYHARARKNARRITRRR